jgi:hypothetical protein
MGQQKETGMLERFFLDDSVRLAPYCFRHSHNKQARGAQLQLQIFLCDSNASIRQLKPVRLWKEDYPR